MLGKLQSWKGDHGRSKEWRHSGVGGLVSIEDLGKKPKTPPAAKPAKKKVPFLSLGKQNITLKSLQKEEEENVGSNAAPVAADVSLFSNIPASAGLTPTFPRSETSRPASPTRPKTADPERASFARRRSKTSPAGDAPHLTLDFSDKPLPLTLDFDHARKRSVSTNHSRKTSAAENGASIARPRTSQSMDGPSSRKRSNSTASKHSKPSYSLTPAISPAESRRPSLSGADIQKIAQVALSKTMSNTSTTSASATRQRSNSRSDMIMPPPERPAPVPSPARSVLDEVGGTLSATIRELQDLQGEWDHPEADAPRMPVRMSSLMYRMPTPPESTTKSAPPTQEYFPVRSHSHETVPTTDDSRPPSRTPSVNPSQPTTPRSTRPPETPSLGRMQSIQIAYEKSKSTAHKLGVENDTLKQQMKFLRERFAEIGDLKQEKDTLEVALDESRRNLETCLAKLQNCKVNEQALQNNLTNVTRRLEEANVQKVDVLEQNGDLQDNVLSLQKELAQMRKEMEELRQRPQASEVNELKAQLAKSEEENKLLLQQVKEAEGRADLPAIVADLTFKLDDVKRTTAEKDKYISELEASTESLTTELATAQEERAKLAETNATMRTRELQKHNQSNKRLSTLNKQIEQIEKARTAAVADSERHLQLLKEQLRRNANDVHKREHPASNLLEKKLNIDEAITEVRLKFERKKAKEESGETGEESEEKDPQTRIRELEKEIEYHVKDIVLYKLDVKGYRKDLKRAKEKIAALSDGANTKSPESRPSPRKHTSTVSVQQLSPSTPGRGESDSEKESLSPATPAVATALQVQVQVPMRHIVSAYAAPMEVQTPLVSA